MVDKQAAEPLPARLVKAALDCFLADDYHNVTTRLIAERAGANASMIRYYFGSKEGLYEAMLRETMEPLLAVLDKPMFSSVDGFGGFLCLYYETMSARPELPRLLLRLLTHKQGPGRQFMRQLLQRGRKRAARKVSELKAKGQVASAADPDVVRMAFVSLAMTPMLLKDIFEEQMERPMDAVFLHRLAEFNGRLFTAGLKERA